MITSILTLLFVSFKDFYFILLFAKTKGFKQHSNATLHVAIAITIPTFLTQELFASHTIICIKLL
jgi:hypothetical protein